MFIQALGLAAALSNPVPAIDPCPQLLELLAAAPDVAQVGSIDHLGANTVSVIADALATQPDDLTTARLLDILVRTHDARAAAAIRPYAYSASEEIAVLATRALPMAAGARAIPTLEQILASRRSFAQTLAAIEGLADLHTAGSFSSLSAVAADPDRDPILRAAAIGALPAVDADETRKWLRRLSLAADLSPFLRGRFELLAGELADRSARR